MPWTTAWSKRLLNNPLVEEFYELFLGWSFEGTLEQNLEKGLAGRYGNLGKLRDVSATLSSRLRSVESARALIVLAKAGQPFTDWRDCYRLWVGASEEPFRSFAVEWLYAQRAEGRYAVRVEDVQPFVAEIWKARRASRSLNDYGLTRTARDLIRTATSLGMLVGGGPARTFATVVLSDTSLLFHAHLITEIEGSTARLVDSPLWRLSYMSPADVHAALLRLHQFKRLRYDVAGSLQQVSLPHQSTLKFAEGLAA
ncbi:hypothetical protein [Roseococcus pinisoli]|uniref:DUF1819 family protein n=1 Tax=Roseococcus pinisoli TaxID=2835040 RepID=A0ABS5QCU3_9PROT|nr:hypothetical protein [Roseococcus pinisoli]MBS7811512.1 hypothetical protein [Roseococcus pinisoli]